MSDALNQVLLERLKELERRRDSLQTAIDRMAGEVSLVDKRIEVYRTALALEGAPQLSQAENRPRGEENSISPRESRAEQSKVATIRGEILRIGTQGFEPKQIAKFVREAGISTHNAFAYNVIKRLKDSGELMSEGTLYFPTGKLKEKLGQGKMSFEDH